MPRARDVTNLCHQSERPAMTALAPDQLKTIEQRLLWLSHWMIHNANHIRPKVDRIKVGGHQAS